MAGLQVFDTYGALFDVDQMCECELTDDLCVGDRLLFDTGVETFTFVVTLIERYGDLGGGAPHFVGVGLRGSCAEQILPGDFLQIEERAHPTPTDLQHINVMLDDSVVEVQRQLASV